MSEFRTPQEQFWAGKFGKDYIGRNDSKEILSSNLNFFSKALTMAGKISSCIEFGANIGLNLHALKLLYPGVSLKAVEINRTAASKLVGLIGADNVFNGSILDYAAGTMVDLVLIKGVLIHINPDQLEIVYEKLYESAGKYILVAEYYNPTPVSVNYRGHTDKLFKRDFAGELLDKYDDLQLKDYGFIYKRDPAFPQDDITWFLLEKC